MRTFEGEVLQRAFELKKFTTREIISSLSSIYPYFPRHLLKERIKYVLKKAQRQGLIKRAGKERGSIVWEVQK